MATAYTHADTVQWVHSGAASVGGVQHVASACLGGNRSTTEVKSIVALFENPVPQIAIERIHGGNGTGTGTLTVTGASAVKYTGPSGTIGSEVTIANGATVLVEDTEPDKCLRISRDSATDLAIGEAMTLACVYPFGNAVGMDIVSHAERAAGHDTYSGIFAYLPTTAVTTFKVWIKTLGTQRATGTAQLGATGAGTITTATANGFADWPTSGWARIRESGGTLLEIVYYTSRTATSLTVPAAGRARLGTSTGSTFGATDLVDAVPGIRIAKEAPSSHAIQVIADDETAPTGVTWNTGVTSATGLDIGALSAGDSYGLWIHREIPAGATAHADLLNAINVQFTAAAVVYDQQLYGVYAMQDTGIDAYEVYVGVDANPDLTAAATDTSSLPFTVATTPPGSGTKQYRLTVVRRSTFNLRGLSQYIRTIEIDDNGDEVVKAPTAPQNVTLTLAAGGEVDVTATYYADQDGASPANYFRIYYELDADPTTGVSPYVDVAVATDAYFGEPAYRLNHALGPFSTGADLRVLVVSYRSSDTTESTNTTASQIDVTTGPPTVVTHALGLYGDGGYGHVFGASSNTTTTYVDQANNIYFINDAQGTSFYGNTALIWRWIVDDATLYIPNTWDIDTTSSITGTGSDGLEVISWTVGDKRIGVNVDGNRRMVLDVTNEVIYVGSVDTTALYGYYHTNAPSYALEFEHVFNAWNAATFTMETYAHLSDGGDLTVDGSIDIATYDQSGIEAL